MRRKEMELWDLYDLDRNVTGKTHVRGEPIPDGYYRLVVHICIFNSEGKMLIQHRTPSKRAYPNVWDLSAGGAAILGDDSHTAASRELYEELGIRYDFSRVRPVLTTCFDNGFNDVYCINLDVDQALLLERLCGRRVCKDCGESYHVSRLNGETKCVRCGGELYQRKDDNPETVQSRLDVYNAQTAPLIAYYKRKGNLFNVSGNATPDEVNATVTEKLNAMIK
jgi:hypothetical protein